MDKKAFLYIVIGAILLLQNTFADAAQNYSRPIADEAFENYLQSYTLFIPAGITTDAVLSQEINSNTATVGQSISAVLTDDFKYKDTIIASAGSVFLGSVVYNKKAGLAGKSAQMQIRFTAIRTPYCNIIPVSAIIATSDLTGILKGSSSQTADEQAKEPKISIAQTELKGSLGLAKVVATKGDNILIPSDSRIKLVFEQPITVGAH